MSKDKETHRMNQSSLYRSMLNLKSELTEKLDNVNQYLKEGTAVTKISYFDANNNLICSQKKRSKWTTAIGKNSVMRAHEDFIGLYTHLFIPEDACSLKVESPFIDDNITTKKVPYTAYRDVQVIQEKF